MMKKYTFPAMLALAFSLSAGAQDMYFAKTLGEAHYYGTARSAALGNAMTALGGDLGSVGLNPAGSAVAAYGQFTVTPGLVISAVSASYAPDGENYGAGTDQRHTRFALPNIGFNMRFDTGNASGIRAVNFGFTANTANSFQRYSTTTGINPATSYAGGLAAAASGRDPNTLGGILYTAYNANMFGHYDTIDWKYMAGNQSLSPDGSYIYLTAPMSQRSLYDTYGSRTDLLLNVGLSLGDRLYLGANMGFPVLQYRRSDYFYEASVSDVCPVSFVDEYGQVVTTNYRNSSMEYRLNTNASGIYGKIGFIWLPLEGLRIGAAVQTPTGLNVNENWRFYGSSSYEDSKFAASFSSELGEQAYHLRTPWLFDLGIAYTFGSIALVSADYEWTDYSVMRYSSRTSRGLDYTRFYGVNETNRLFCGISHAFRLGVEVKPLPFLSLRAGANLTTDPEKIWTTADGRICTADDYLGPDGNPRDISLVSFRYKRASDRAYSFGVGYSSPGSFFLDAAVRCTRFAQEIFAPYYYGGYAAVDKDGVPLGYINPLSRLDRSLWDVLLTVGWRF